MLQCSDNWPSRISELLHSKNFEREGNKENVALTTMASCHYYLTRKKRKESIFEVEENRIASYGFLGALEVLAVLSALSTLGERSEQLLNLTREPTNHNEAIICQ
jgi:hypothetical protein